MLLDRISNPFYFRLLYLPTHLRKPIPPRLGFERGSVGKNPTSNIMTVGFSSSSLPGRVTADKAKRNNLGVSVAKANWLRLAPVPAGVKICWNWALGLDPCRKFKGDASVCKAVTQLQHRWPQGVNKDKFLAWLAQKP